MTAELANTDLMTLDIAQVLHLLTLKARIFAEAREPVKGLSIALRAAATAERLLIIPVLVEAVAALAGVLMALGEFAAARSLLEGGIVYVSTNFSADQWQPTSMGLGMRTTACCLGS